MTTTDTAPVTASQLSRERLDLLASLQAQRDFLRFTVRDLTSDQARLRPTVSALCLGGLIKHVTQGEQTWMAFVLEGPSAMPDFTQWTEADMAERARSFDLLPEETLAGVLTAYAEVAARTDELVATLPDLDASWPLPDAPWFEQGARWSVRRVFTHLLAETAQHAGHADIVREAIDGQRTMG